MFSILDLRQDCVEKLISETPVASEPKRLLLFDLDGVLLDSKSNMEFAWAAVRENLGVTVEFGAYFAQIGRPFKDIMLSLGLAAQAEEIEAVYFKTSVSSPHLLKWYPGVAETLSGIQSKGVKMGIVTSKDANRTTALLSGLPVKFDTVQTPAPGLRGKPAPDHILLACALLNVDPAQAMFIGDMLVDCEAARRAGVAYAHAMWGYGALPVGHCREIASVGEIAEVLEFAHQK